MGFGDLRNVTGLTILNQFLEDKSYIEGFQPSQADVVIFKCLSTSPASKFEHALRWYNHISSYGSGMVGLPGVAKSISDYGPLTSEQSSGDALEKDEDDFDLFDDDDDDEEDAEAVKIREERLAAYAAKKANKPTVIAKSNVIFDVKPWDDETPMEEVENCVRSIELDGLKWGISKLVPVGYGIKKLQITTVIEDDKVSVDLLEEKITGFDDYIQSVDIVAFNKI